MDNNFYYNDNNNDVNINNQNNKKNLNYIIIILLIILIIILIIFIFSNLKNNNIKDDSVTRETAKVSKIETINFNESNVILFDDETKQLSVTYYPSNLDVDLEYQTSDNEVVVIDNEGLITPVSEGEATITVIDKISSKKSSIKIEVTKKNTLVEKVIVKEDNVSLKTNNKYTIEYSVEPSNADNKEVEIKTLNRDICTVDDNIVTTKKIGTCNVVVKALDDSGIEAKIAFNITSDFKLNSKDSYDLLLPTIREYVNEAKKYEVTSYKSSIQSKYFKNKNTKAQSVLLEFTTSLKGPYIIELSKDAFNTISNIYSVTENKANIYNLESGTTYYYRVKSNGSYSEIGTFSTVEGPRPVYIDGVANSRDLGGYNTDSNRKTLQGLIYRSANLDKVTASGKKTIKELGIKTELDLREKGSSKIDTKYIRISSHYYKYVILEKKHMQTEGKILKVFTDYDNYPIIFHCAIGRDRTGTLGFILQAIYGVSEVDSNIDYEFTGTLARTKSLKGMSEAFRKLEGSINREKARYYLLNKIGFTRMEVSNMYNIMLGGPIVLSDSLTKLSNNSINVNLRNHKIENVYCGNNIVKYNKEGKEDNTKITLLETCKEGKIKFSEDYEIEFQM